MILDMSSTLNFHRPLSSKRRRENAHQRIVMAGDNFAGWFYL
jgi:hypothetical protein